MDEAIKRSNIRYLIDLEVKVEPKEKPAFPCKVRDYCLSGMFLNLLRENDAPLPPVPVGKNESIIVEFPAPNGKRHRIPAQVAHAVAGGFGLRFASISDEALNALIEIATKQQAKAEQGPTLAGDWQSAGRPGLMLLLKDTLQRHLVGLFNNFHETLVDVIFERASRPRNTNEQNQMFEALDYLNQNRAASFQKIFGEIAAGFDAYAGGKKPSPRLVLETPAPRQSSALSLVDDREFEEWLWASSTVAALEAEHDEQLFNLNQRLASLQGYPLDNESNPVGAAAISRAFQELIGGFQIADSVRELVITTFQQLMAERFGALITEFNNLLIERGILPEVKRDMTIVRLGLNSKREAVKPISIEPTTRPSTSQAQPVDIPRTVTPNKSAQTSTGSAYPQGGTSGLSQVRNLLRSSQAGDAGVATSAGTDGGTAFEGSGGGAGSAGATGGASSSGASGSVGYAGANGGAMSAGAAGATHGSPSSGSWYGTNDLTAALGSIESRISDIRANRNKGDSILAQLKASLARMGADPNKAIAPAQQESIEVIDNLMGSVHEDPIVAAEARPWLEQLEVPLLKTAIRDESLIENRDHPATHFLNRLDAIGKSLAAEENERTSAVRKEISTLIEQVKEKSDSDDPAFDQALSRLEDLHDSMRRQYEASVAELIRRCDEEYELESKREALLKLLDDHFDGQMVPAIIFELMDAGWKNLLLRSFVREGADGRIFLRFLEVIDQGIAHLTGDHSRIGGKPWPEATLLELIPRGLRQVPVEEALIEKLLGKLTQQFSVARSSPSSITLKPMPRIMEIAEDKRRRAHDAVLASLKVPEERWRKAEDSVRSMGSGDMITLIDSQAHKHGHRLVWIAPNQSRYVFVDGEGHLSSDMNLIELTRLLLQEKVAILEGWDVPLMDRATYSMLLSIHKKLLSQSNSDTLTGLQNRRAFELELEKVLERTRIDKTKNILCYLDLDHFSLVNSMCSHDEGDRLLKEVADILRQHAPEKTRIGRLGGDEFALLMPDLSRTEGMLAVRALQQAMHAHKFQCKTHSYRLAASFGIAEINELGESGTRLMSAVEHACRNAKEAGRDRIEIHHESNGDLTRREKLINMVGQIRDAMDNDRMQLVCQRILPVTDREMEQAPYYEILLRVHDENGQPVSHEQFIQAAEMYNRTIEVDRWVVHTVMEWLEQRQAAGKPLPIVSVNLSGRSVNNKEFMDTIAERIIKCTIPRNHLCFEITETAAIGNMGQATHFINRIKRLGCSFSLDDFGTGVSSYSYLKALPVDYIKIDGSFVRNCHQEPHDQAVIKSINELGHAMGKKTIAEFVENEDILSRLHEVGVDYAQGYGIEMPIPITQLN